ncbi:MAG: hypothetical protein ABF292_04415, partial [Desulfobacterales bacterium]
MKSGFIALVLPMNGRSGVGLKACKMMLSVTLYSIVWLGRFHPYPKCQGKMRIISWIEDEEVIKKILKHLGLWLPKRSPPPARAHAPPQAVRI